MYINIIHYSDSSCLSGRANMVLCVPQPSGAFISSSSCIPMGEHITYLWHKYFPLPISLPIQKTMSF